VSVISELAPSLVPSFKRFFFHFLNNVDLSYPLGVPSLFFLCLGIRAPLGQDYPLFRLPRVSWCLRIFFDLFTPSFLLFRGLRTYRTKILLEGLFCLLSVAFFWDPVLLFFPPLLKYLLGRFFPCCSSRPPPALFCNFFQDSIFFFDSLESCSRLNIFPLSLGGLKSSDSLVEVCLSI